jgi:hypothetical protein
MSRILVVRQVGFTHLRYCGSNTLLHFGIACVRWGGYWAAFACLSLLWMSGWQSISERLDVVFLWFGLGFAVRFSDEMGDRQLIVEEEELHLVRSRGYGSHYAHSEVREFVVKLVAPTRLLVKIKWADTRRTTSTICGIVQDPIESLKHLRESYTVIDETGFGVDS